MKVTGNSEGRTHLDGIVNEGIWKVTFDLIWMMSRVEYIPLPERVYSQG